MWSSATLAAAKADEKLVEAVRHETVLREQLASRERDLQSREDALGHREASAALLERDLASREQAVATRESEVAAREAGLQVREEKLQGDTAALQTDRQRHQDLVREASIRQLENTQALRTLLARTRAILEGLRGEVPVLNEEADDARCLQVFQEMAEVLETMPKEMDSVVEAGGRSLLTMAATCILSNVRR